MLPGWRSRVGREHKTAHGNRLPQLVPPTLRSAGQTSSMARGVPEAARRDLFVAVGGGGDPDSIH